MSIQVVHVQLVEKTDALGLGLTKTYGCDVQVFTQSGFGILY